MTQTPEQRKAKALQKARARSQVNQQVTKASRKLKKAERNARRGRDNKLLRQRAGESGLILPGKAAQRDVQDASRLAQEAAAFEREAGKQ